MQVDPIKTRLNAPGSMLLILICDGLLSNVAFKFNLRHYNKAFSRILLKFGSKDSGIAHSIAAVYSAHEVRRCRLTLSNQR